MMPSDYQSMKPHSLLEFQDAAHCRVWIFSGITHFSKESFSRWNPMFFPAELGDYDPQEHTMGYISEFRFTPNQVKTHYISNNIILS